VGDGASIEIALNLPYRKINGTITIPAKGGISLPNLGRLKSPLPRFWAGPDRSTELPALSMSKGFLVFPDRVIF